MAHSKVYGFCDAKCKVEVVPKKGGTFEGQVFVPYLTITNDELETNILKPSTTVSRVFAFRSKDGKQTGSVANFTQSNGNRVSFLSTTGIDGTTIQRIDLWHLADNTAYVTLPSWSVGTNDNSDKALTIKMANKLPSLVHRYDAEQIDGEKLFTTPIIDPFNMSGKCQSPNSGAGDTPYYCIASFPASGFINNDRNILLFDVVIGREANIISTATFEAILQTYGDAVFGNATLTLLSRSGTSHASSSAENWCLTYNATAKEVQLWVKITSGQTYVFARSRINSNRNDKASKWKFNWDPTAVASLPAEADGWNTISCVDMSNKLVASTDPSAVGKEIATADWVNNKLAQKNKVTNVTSFDQLIELIKNGKRGDSFGLTVDYTGNSMGGITNMDGVETHAFGHYTIEELTVSDSTLNSFQAFGSGEVTGKFVKDDSTSYVHATTGFGRAKVFEGLFDAFRVVEDGALSYFIIGSANVTSFEGYYISI